MLLLHLQVDVNVDYTEFKFPVEVIIGTIPLREQYAPCPVIITQPTAPLPLQDFGSNQPPPFSSISGFFYDMRKLFYDHSLSCVDA